LKYFWKFDVSITHIESRPSLLDSDKFNVYIDFYGAVGEENTDKLVRELKLQCSSILLLDQREVPWFPRHISELDVIANRALITSTGTMETDHPGFNDQTYRHRRNELSVVSYSYRQCCHLKIIS